LFNALVVCELIKNQIFDLFCSGGNDHATKFWCRNRPGDLTRDRYNSGQMQGCLYLNLARYFISFVLFWS
jgi:hypothetical protein